MFASQDLRLDCLLDAQANTPDYGVLKTLVNEIDRLDIAIRENGIRYRQAAIKQRDETQKQMVLTETQRQKERAQRAFSSDCAQMAEYLLDNINPTKTLRFFSCLNSEPLSKKEILKDISLLTKTVQFARDFVSHPELIDQNLDEFKQHGEEIEKQLSVETPALKRHRLWGAVLMASAVLLEAVLLSSVLSGAAIACIATGGTAIPPIAFLATCYLVLGTIIIARLFAIGHELRAGNPRLEAQAELHKNVGQLMS